MYKMGFRMPHEHSWMLALSAQRVSAIHISRCRGRILPGALRDSSINFINGSTSTSSLSPRSLFCSNGFSAYSTWLLARNMARRTRVSFSTTEGAADHFRRKEQWLSRQREWNKKWQLRKSDPCVPAPKDLVGQRAWFRKRDDNLLLLNTSLLTEYTRHEKYQTSCAPLLPLLIPSDPDSLGRWTWATLR